MIHRGQPELVEKFQLCLLSHLLARRTCLIRFVWAAVFSAGVNGVGFSFWWLLRKAQADSHSPESRWSNHRKWMEDNRIIQGNAPSGAAVNHNLLCLQTSLKGLKGTVCLQCTWLSSFSIRRSSMSFSPTYNGVGFQSFRWSDQPNSLNCQELWAWAQKWPSLLGSKRDRLDV